MFARVSTVDAEVVVIGAGIAGLATAWELSRDGRDVVVVDQFELGHDRGSSHGDSRVFRLSYPQAQWVRLAQNALSGWRAYESAFAEPLLRTTGSIDVGPHASDNSLALADCDAAASMIAPREAARRFGLSLVEGETGLFQPDAGVIAAARTLQLLREAAVGARARVICSTRVELIEPADDGVLMHTSTGLLRARAVIVAAGAWARELVGPIGVDLPVRVTRETVAYLDVGRTDELPVLVFADHPATRSGHGVATYALADGPERLKVGLHHTGPAVEPDSTTTVDATVEEWAAHWAAERLPSRCVALAGSQTCLYTTTADESFILERHGRIVIGSACSGHGFKFAPVIGSTLARLAGQALTDS